MTSVNGVNAWNAVPITEKGVTMSMTKFQRMKRFYLTDHDFQIYVNKNCQTYGRCLDDELKSPITEAYYDSLQKGGCNARSRYPDNDEQ